MNFSTAKDNLLIACICTITGFSGSVVWMGFAMKERVVVIETVQANHNNQLDQHRDLIRGLDDRVTANEKKLVALELKIFDHTLKF